MHCAALQGRANRDGRCCSQACGPDSYIRWRRFEPRVIGAAHRLGSRVWLCHHRSSRHPDET